MMHTHRDTPWPLRRVLRAAAIALLASAALSACQSTISSLPLIHKQDILQGNVLDKDELAQVREGMSKRQILLLLGSPAVADPFHDQRWDYVYTLARRGGKLTQKVLTLHFEEDRLLRMEGDYLDVLELAQGEAEEVEEAEQRRAEEEDS